MRENLVAYLKQNYNNSIGWRTSRKIVVFESDDWGSIRTPSNNSLSQLKNFGIPVEKCQYMLNDSLETADDLSSLFTVLSKYKDSCNQSVKFTANTIMANPDFEKIQKSDFKDYFFEPFTTSYQKYQSKTDTWNTFKSGIENGLFQPQLHGREHLNISRWMTDLQAGNPEILLAFELQMTGVSAHVSKFKRGSYQAAFDGGKKELTYDHATIINDAAKLFTEIFGFQSKSFIAPNYIWDETLERLAFANGIVFLQGSRVQRMPNDYGANSNSIRHYMGQKNKFGQRYLVRNCIFEPTLEPKHAVNVCLNSISNAFLWNKPAIISTHRANYIGSLNPKQAQQSLSKLDELLLKITKKWPDVIFLFSDELGDLLQNNDRN
jgi:hypothetical protein